MQTGGGDWPTPARVLNDDDGGRAHTVLQRAQSMHWQRRQDLERAFEAREAYRQERRQGRGFGCHTRSPGNICSRGFFLVMAPPVLKTPLICSINDGLHLRRQMFFFLALWVIFFILSIFIFPVSLCCFTFGRSPDCNKGGRLGWMVQRKWSPY